MSGEGTPRVPGARRMRGLVMGAGAAAVALVVLEVASAALFLVVDREGFSWRRLAAERAQVAEKTPPVERTVHDPRAEAPGDVRTQTIHPYVGFLVDPDAPATHEAMEEFRLTFDPLGFFRHESLAGDPPPDAFVVGVYGGSVAMIFANRGLLLMEALDGRTELGGRPVWVVNRAVPGHKQPQQLMALAWSLAVGDRLDAVVLLDGFNDVVLPVTENLPQGVHPFYPRAWPFRTSSLPDPAVLERAGEAVYLESVRRRRARLFSRPVLRHSVTASLAWRLLDRRLEARQTEARIAAMQLGSSTRRYTSHGPRWEGPRGLEATREAAALWARCSLEMRALCEGAGIPFVHVLQPNQYVPGSKPLSAGERRTAYDPDHPYRPAVLAGYPHLRREVRGLQAAGVRFVDATMAFSDVEETLYLDTCCHFNSLGNRIVARRVAAALVAELAALGDGPPAVSP